MPSKVKDITFYQRKVSVYNARREHHRSVASSLAYKIKLCKDQIRRIKKRDEKIKSIISNIEEYYGYKVNLSDLYLGIYFKYGMEHGISGKYLKDYIGIENHRIPGIKRLAFTKMMQKHTEISKQYHGFIKHMKTSCK